MEKEQSMKIRRCPPDFHQESVKFICRYQYHKSVGGELPPGAQAKETRKTAQAWPVWLSLASSFRAPLSEVQLISGPKFG
jgi:hypothetical protein